MILWIVVDIISITILFLCWLHRFVSLVIKALHSELSVFRYMAAKCMATICSVVTVEGMTALVEKVLPSISNPVDLHFRQGAIEVIYHLIDNQAEDGQDEAKDILEIRSNEGRWEYYGGGIRASRVARGGPKASSSPANVETEDWLAIF